VRRLAVDFGPGQVKVVDSFQSGHITRFQRDNGSWIINPQRDICALDLRVPQQAERYLRGADYVYHLAEVGPCTAPHVAVFQDNVLISSNTLQACRVNTISNFIYVSNACSPAHRAVHERHGAAAESTATAAAATAYVESKLTGEYEAEMVMSSASGFNLGIVRLQHVYGPGSNLVADNTTLLVLPLLLHNVPAALDRGSSLTVQGAPDDVLGDYVYVDDVVDALLLVKDRGMNKGVIEVGSGQGLTVKQLADAVIGVSHALDKTVRVQYDSTAPPFGNMTSVCVSAVGINQSQSLLGWQPHYNLQRAVAATLGRMAQEQNRSRVLVILFGQPRGGELAWKSIHKHLLLPNNAHLATILTPTNSKDANRSTTMLEAMAQWVWHVPEPADGDWGVWLDKAAELCPHLGGFQWPDLCRAYEGANGPQAIWAGGFHKCTNYSSMSGVVLVYQWVASQKIMALNLHKQYDHIIFSRPDLLHLCDHHKVTNTSDPAIGVLLGQEWWGYCDRHLVGSSAALLSAINVTQEIVCNAQQYETLMHEGRMTNHESVQARVWEHTGLPVRQFNFTMFTVRSQGDPSSWSHGDNHTDLAPFGLKIKYMDEFERSVAACGVTNITHILKSLQQHQVPWFA
jgi:nucleoside-diphosphate-sugar epimerase